ncbi:tripartite tricarboxylate transporter substrate-binding protein [Hydrogenophaga borbori]|uniref:tripartite tricarboxylate transporter substrate-binding protein n=1 Tax=Hydrogenophaga borbori TaxID=2294117 RepID=UPI00301C75DF
MKTIGKALIVALASALLCTVAQAQAYPNRPIRLVVPYPAGGIADTVSRSVGQQLARRLGQPVVIDNRPGGKQIIATEAVTKAAPDGYTLLLGSVTNLSLNPAGIARLPYNVERDLTPVSQLFHAPLLLVTNQPVANAQELIARIKEKPGKFAYPAAFDCLDHNLVPVARFGNYRGFLFASLRPDVPDLLDHLGDARRFLDLVVDQSEEGVEIVPGEVVYTYQGNWKMQVENALDLYHFTSTHPSYLQVLQQRGRRRQQDGAGQSGAAQSIYENLGAQRQAQRGSMSFAHGHVAYWGDNPNAAERPLYAGYEPLVQRVGREVADWMLRVRNLVIYPNLQIVENASLQMRVLRPLAVDRTEVTSYCLAPRNEPAQAREKRIRQYEEFYNPSGMATPDDVAVYEACQRGHGARGLSDQQGYLRGLGLGAVAPGQGARELGIAPVSAMQGGYDLADETCFHAGYREWQRLILKGVEHA